MTYKGNQMDKKVFQLAVTGGRNFNNREKVYQTLDAVNRKRPITLLIHGAARGADSLSGSWAKSRQIPVREFHAEWDKFGKSAGHRRNRKMLDEGKPDGVVAFPGGRGTAGMVSETKRRNITIYQPFS